MNGESPTTCLLMMEAGFCLCNIIPRQERYAIMVDLLPRALRCVLLSPGPQAYDQLQGFMLVLTSASSATSLYLPLKHHSDITGLSEQMSHLMTDDTELTAKYRGRLYLQVWRAPDCAVHAGWLSIFGATHSFDLRKKGQHSLATPSTGFHDALWYVSKISRDPEVSALHRGRGVM
ncbi:hypothetical protein HPB51_022566 [Rhipicephalus microplus]|uniref:Uncharacterized protein n=1 Tax=Rhipicephalus microplus TaxID=6941 RepID=A0A9J6DCP2_RHIMP|nr:hypothetical protein HPB51_022566 [Rhipicephalus microplus]